MRKDDEETLEKLPRSVQIVVGDLGDPATMKEAVEGCNKIVFCATARSTITGDLTRVDHQGVYNLSKAFQVHVGAIYESCPLGVTVLEISQ